MKIRGEGKTKTGVCEACGHEKPASPAVLSGKDSYQYFEIHVAGRRISFHVAKAEGETDVYFVDGILRQEDNKIFVEVA